MKVQVEQLREYGVDAVYLNSSLKHEVYEFNVRKVKSGKVKMLYVAPETLMMEKTREMLADLKVDCFTIDEHLQELHSTCIEGIMNSEFYDLID
jgi:ATP-dependent DNA helicase RecQ